MDCKEVIKRIPDFLNHELNSRELKEFLNHIEGPVIEKKWLCHFMKNLRRFKKNLRFFVNLCASDEGFSCKARKNAIRLRKRIQSHIGFNEPADEFIPETHCVDLTPSTIEANKRFFASYDDVPLHLGEAGE